MPVRAASATTVLLTGATGALGGELLARLTKRRHEVICLVRAKNGFAAQQRLNPLLSANSTMKVIHGDITQPCCGIGEEDRQQLFGRVKVLLHCAASIDFRERTINHLTNVRGVHHVQELADLLDVRSIHHVPTAFVAGTASVFREADELSPVKHRPRNEVVRWVINTSLAHLKTRGLRIADSLEQKEEIVRKQSRLVRSVFQRKLDSMITQFNPYTNHDIDFEMEAARQTLGNDFQEPCVLDQHYLGRLLDYAVFAEWKRGGFPQAALDRRDAVPKRRAYGLQLPHLRFD